MAATRCVIASSTARTITSYAARPASALSIPGANRSRCGGRYGTGSQTASTRGSAAACATISGPTPAGSPEVIAIRGFLLATAAAATAAGSASAGVVAPALAAAAAMSHAFGIGQLVTQAAFQAAAQSGQLRGIQAELLLLGHLDGDRLERRQPRGAAERPATRPVPADHLRLVADADLPHFDAGVKLGRQLADELAEVDTAVSGEVEGQLRAVERQLDARELHHEAALS